MIQACLIQGTFNDRYLPYLYEFLKKNNKSVLIHPVFHGFRYNFFTIFKKISCCTEDFIIQEKYLKPMDYFHAGIYPVRFLKQKIITPDFHGFDLTEIIIEDQMKVDVQNMLQAILTFQLIQRLKNHDLKLHSFIDWYENQTLDRALVAGVHSSFPMVKTIGAQIFLHFPNFLSFSPSPSEVRAGIVPDIILTTSCYQCGLAKVFDPFIKCFPAAALRYAHVFDDEKHDTSMSVSPLKCAFVLTSFNHEETVELLQMIQEIMKSLREDVTLCIQFHPDIRIDEIIKQVPEIQRDTRFRIFSGTLVKGIQEASVVVSKGSGSIVEAVAKGTPAIFVGNQNKLNLNPLAGIPEAFSVSARGARLSRPAQEIEDPRPAPAV